MLEVWKIVTGEAGECVLYIVPCYDLKLAVSGDMVSCHLQLTPSQASNLSLQRQALAAGYLVTAYLGVASSRRRRGTYSPPLSAYLRIKRTWQDIQDGLGGYSQTKVSKQDMGGFITA